MLHKVYVDVTVEFYAEEGIIPLSIKWEDGTVYEIDKVLDIRRAASLKSCDIGMRYKCRIRGKETYLWYEEPKWFVEGK